MRRRDSVSLINQWKHSTRRVEVYAVSYIVVNFIA